MQNEIFKKTPLISKYNEYLSDDSADESELEESNDILNQPIKSTINMMTQNHNFNQIKPFTGTQEQIFTDWLQKLEDIFELDDVKKKDDEKIWILRKNLEGEARKFFSTLNVEVDTQYDTVIDHFKTQYNNDWNREIAKCKLTTCKTGDEEKLSEFIPRFKKIAVNRTLRRNS